MMNGKLHQAGQNQPANSSEPTRKPTRTVLLVLSVLILGPLLFYLVVNLTMGNKPAAESISPEQLRQLALTQTPTQTRRDKATAPPPQGDLGNSGAAADASTGSQSASSTAQGGTEPTPYTRQLINALSQIELSGGAMTRAQADQWKQNLRRLIQEGETAVPAIREFLEKNLDVDFGSVRDGRLTGYGTLRAGLIDALQQIGGPEAMDASLHTLQTTADPAEVALLARFLEQQAPGQYHETALKAALEVLNQATTGEWDSRRDLNPLFEFLQKYGDASVVADLEKAAARWSQYAAMTLAELPDGAGIKTLIQLAGDTAGTASGSREAAIRSLAQVAASSDQAGNALLEQAKLNNIPDSAWPAVASALSGFSLRYGNQVFGDPTVSKPDTQTFHVATGNQNYRGVSAAYSWTPAQIRQHINYIDQLLAVTANSVAIKALQEARAALVRGPTR